MYSLDRFARFLSRRTIPEPLALYRILVGLVAVVSALVTHRDLAELYAPLNVRLRLVPGIPDLGPDAVNAYVGLWLTAAALFTVGLFTRTAGALVVAAIAYRLLLDESLLWGQIYLCGLLVLLVSLGDGGAAFSLDRLLKGGPRRLVPLWAQTLICFQIAVFYLFAGLGKINPLAAAYFFTAVPLLQAIGSPALAAFVCQATIAFELTIPFALWFRRVQFRFFLAGFVFHVGILVSIGFYAALLAYGALCVGAYFLFPDWQRRRGTLSGPGPRPAWLLWVDWFQVYEWQRGGERLTLRTAQETSHGPDAFREVLRSSPLVLPWGAALEFPPLRKLADALHGRLAPSATIAAR